MNDREKLLQIRNLIDEHLNEETGIEITEVQAEVEGNRLEVYVQSNWTQDREYDVLYSRTDQDKIHSLAYNYRDGRGLPLLSQGGVDIGFSGKSNWMVKVVVYDRFELREENGATRWFGVGASIAESEWVHAVKKDNGEPETPDPKPEPELITILSEETGMGLSLIQGVAQFSDSIRIYYNDKEGDSRYQWFMDTSDLETFTKPRKIRVLGAPEGSKLASIKVFYRNGKWYGGGHGVGDNMNRYWSRDGVTWEYKGVAFTGRMDGGHSFFYNPDTKRWIWTGRVRGENTGNRPCRWDNPPYGRRGISKHETVDFWGDWQGGIWADPMDYFDYKKPVNPSPSSDQLIGPDFYSGMIGYWDESVQKVRGFTTVYFNEPDRGAVGRQDSQGRNTRWTGEMYSIQTEIRNGKLHIRSLNSPFPLEPHRRKSEYPNATRPDAREVGQIYTHPGIYRVNGNRYIFYFLRDDTHYEARQQRDHLTAIYAAKI